MLIATWITAVSTLIMCICAIVALTTWKKEFKTNKICGVYEDLLTRTFEIEDFLANLYALYEKEDFCKEKLEKYSNEFKLYSIKLLIVKNAKLSILIKETSEALTPMKYYTGHNGDGSYDLNWDKFIDLYFKNINNFKNIIDKNITKIIESCREELKKFYK